jgi:hypothetical protein
MRPVSWNCRSGLRRKLEAFTRAEWIATGLSDHAPLILDVDPDVACRV